MIKKSLKKMGLAVTILSSLSVSLQAFAGASANIGVTSNYISRGVEQTQGGPALQAGLDYEADNGLYVGTWASNAKVLGKEGTEADASAGWKKELSNGASVDVGASRYTYTGQVLPQFTETYLKGGYRGVSAEVWHTSGANADPAQSSPKNGDIYYNLGYEGSLNNNWKYSAKVGLEKWKDPTVADITDTELALTKTLPKAGELTFSLTKTDKQDTTIDPTLNDVRGIVSWAKTFDF